MNYPYFEIRPLSYVRYKLLQKIITKCKLPNMFINYKGYSLHQNHDYISSNAYSGNVSLFSKPNQDGVPIPDKYIPLIDECLDVYIEEEFIQLHSIILLNDCRIKLHELKIKGYHFSEEYIIAHLLPEQLYDLFDTKSVINNKVSRFISPEEVTAFRTKHKESIEYLCICMFKNLIENN